MHAATQSGDGTPYLNFNCVQCDNSFKTQRGLNIHISKKHRLCISQNDAVLNLDQPFLTTPLSDQPNSIPFHSYLSELKNNVPVVKRVPRGARITVANHLSGLIIKCVENNQIDDWHNLFLFSFKTLHAKKDKTISLTQKIKNNCVSNTIPHISRPSGCASSTFNRTKLIESKISDGDLKGAARLLFTNDVLSPDTPDTLSALRSKHPPAPSVPHLFAPPTSDRACLQIEDKDVIDAIFSFKNGSAAGLDGISPQHLKDLISHSVGDAGVQLISSLTKLVNFMFSGKINTEILPILYGANLIALTKKDGGVRPIAVGSTLRRLASKIAVQTARGFWRSEPGKRVTGYMPILRLILVLSWIRPPLDWRLVCDSGFRCVRHTYALVARTWTDWDTMDYLVKKVPAVFQDMRRLMT
ncbi:uncharacterized protein LOC134750921 [Cydia strobilella]|uniref:uncharacterized protein LOC134741528 n=1 Tax=Cydia strobilella TaxID=1100964 RepID=UPI003005DBDE